MLLLYIWLLSVTCQSPDIHLSAQEGGLVKISCPYGSGYETYPKYFYVGEYAKRKPLIKTTGYNFKKPTQEGKYEIHDDTKRRILHVTIHNLNLNDAGTYWCEIDAYGFDPKTEIKLKVDKARAALAPPRVTSKPPILTSAVKARSQQQSAGTTESVRSATTWFTSPDGLHTESPEPPQSSLPLLAGPGLYLALGASVLLSLVVVLCIGLWKHKQDTNRRGVGCETSTCSTNIYLENHSQSQPGEPDPPVNISSSDTLYATVTKSRRPGSHTLIFHSGLQRPGPVLNSSISSCLQDDEHKSNMSSVGSSSSEAADPLYSEDIHLLYSTVTRPGAPIRPSAEPSVLYATIKRPIM